MRCPERDGLAGGRARRARKARRVGFGVAAALLGVVACSRAEMRPPTPRDASPSTRLAELLQARRSEANPVNYPIAAGDKVRIRVQQMDELSGEFRVADSGSIVLPLLASVSIAGFTEHQAADKLRGMLAEYVKNPQVSLSVAEIHGSQASVMGAVARPGLYPIRGFNQTIADVITQAGGMTKDAGTEVYLSPAGSSAGAAGNRPDPEASAAVPGLFAGPKQSFAIDLTALYQGRSVAELEIPVRPGDVIVVPSSGEVFVDGWVRNPGALKLTRGMTVTQAIASAGGLHFGAASARILLQRRASTGETVSYPVDYAGISSGSQPDAYLENGDRIQVGSSPVKAGSWGVYSFLKGIVSFGIQGSAPTVGAK